MKIELIRPLFLVLLVTQSVLFSTTNAVRADQSKKESFYTLLEEQKIDCDKGNHIACNIFVSVLVKGGQNQYSAALHSKYFQITCDKSYGGGCFGLAKFYEKGLGGISGDKEKAKSLYAKACKNFYATHKSCKKAGLEDPLKK